MIAKLGSANKQPGNSKVGFRSKNMLQSAPDLKKGSTTNKNVISSIKSGEFGGTDHDDERCHLKNFSPKSAACKQLVSSKQKGHRQVINLKTLNIFMPYHYFKINSPYPPIDLLKQKDYMCQFNLKDASFLFSGKVTCTSFFPYVLV